MPANFRPEMSVIKDLKPFKFWCSKVLPSVYDDSLSYYELLTKVLRYLNDTMESVETLDGNVNNIYNAYLLLEDYVNNYFDNADFQQMVNDKLDEMAEDGTLTKMIGNYVDPLFDQMTEDLDTAIENQNTLIDGRFNTQDTRLGVMESQMNEFIADHAGPAMAFTLWSGYADAVGTNITLSDDPANYDYIEVYLRTVGSSYCPSIHRFPAESFHSTPNLSVVQTEIGNNTNDTRLNEYRINIEPTDSVDATKYRIRYSNHWLWTGTTDSDAINYENNITDEQQASAGIVKIVGIKNVQNNAEVIDARIGANNQTYTTLGDAIRSQVTNLQYAINDRAHIALTSTSDQINLQQGGNGAVSQVSAPTMSKFNSEISELKSAIDAKSGLSMDVKSALMALARAVAFKGDDPEGIEVIDALEDALYPPVNLTRISAVYSGGVVSDKATLNSLKSSLTVTAYYDDSTSERVSDSAYTLIGTLTVGTSTITVAYGGKTTTFTVTVEHNDYLYVMPSEFVSTGANRFDTDFVLTEGQTVTFLIDFTASSIGTAAEYIYGNKVNGTTMYVALQTLAQSNKNYLWGQGISWNNGANLITVGHRNRFACVFTYNVGTNAAASASVKDVTTGGTVKTFSNTYAVTTELADYSFVLGAEKNATSNNGFVGTVHDFRIYDGEMSSADITDYLANGAS